MGPPLVQETMRLADSSRSPTTAACGFLICCLQLEALLPQTCPIYQLLRSRQARLTVGRIPSLPASKTASGVFNAARVGNVVTQTEYDALTPPAANTLYFITA